MLCINIHHLITDGWSCGVLFRDFRDILAEELGVGSGPPASVWQYSRFIRWQEDFFRSDRFRGHLDYWRAQLADSRPPAIPFAPGVISRRTDRIAVDIGGPIGDALRKLARDRRTTIFGVLLSLYYTLLHQKTGESDLAVASIFSNRPRPELQDTVGFLANLLVLRSAPAAPGDVLGPPPGDPRHRPRRLRAPGGPPPAPASRGLAGAGCADEVVFQVAGQPLPWARVGGIEVEAIVAEDIGNRFQLELALVPSREGGFKAVLFFNRDRLDRPWAVDFLDL